MNLLESMTVFVRTADRGSFAAAAAESDISATMAANHVKALEERLGARLLNRTTRRHSLTEFGRSYYEQCLDILKRIADADASALELQKTPRGTLRISVPVSFGAERLMPALAEFLSSHPEIDVDVSLNDRVVDLIEEGYEAAIRIGRLPDSGLIARPLAPYRMAICAAPEYIAKYGEPHEPEDLAGHRCLSFSYGNRQAWRMTGREGSISVRIKARVRANNGQALRIAALNGLGVIMQPEVLLSADIAAGRLVRLLPDYELPTRPMHIVYLPDRHMSPKLRSFIDFAVASFGS